jgi:hypothetical protein
MKAAGYLDLTIKQQFPEVLTMTEFHAAQAVIQGRATARMTGLAFVSNALPGLRQQESSGSPMMGCGAAIECTCRVAAVQPCQ